MSNRTRTQVVAGAVVAVFALGIWLTGGQESASWLKFFSVAVIAASAVLAAWDRYLWHLRPVQKSKNAPRDIRGTWRGELTGHWVDPTTGTSPGPKVVYLVVRQSATSVSVTLLSEESQSKSSFGVISGADSSASLDYMYLNEPNNALQMRSRIHHGSASLVVTGRPASRLRGHYWTDRDSRGDLEFDAHTRGYVEDYESAQKLFGDWAGRGLGDGDEGYAHQ